MENDLFPAVMAANNLEFETTDDQLTIRKSQKKNTSIQNYIILSGIGVSIGLFVLMFVAFRTGFLIMVLAGSFLAAAMNMRQREKDTEKKSIRIGNGNIDIKEGYKTRRIPIDQIAEFKTNVKKEKNLYVGTITILTNDKWPYEFLEIYGSDEDNVLDDLLVISNYVVENYL